MESKPEQIEPAKDSKTLTTLKNVPKHMTYSTTAVILIYLIAWALNTVYNYHFNLSQLLDLYFVLIGRDVAVHGINSVFNSKQGEMPKNDKYNKI